MIAGTSFKLCDLQAGWARLHGRIGRSNSSPELLDATYRIAQGADCIPLMCDDGLLILRLKGSADGTITAFLLVGASFGGIGAFKRQEEAILAVARDVGATRVAFRTDRRGWGKLAGPAWRFDGDVFSRSL